MLGGGPPWAIDGTMSSPAALNSSFVSAVILAIGTPSDNSLCCTCCKISKDQKKLT